MAIAHTSPRTDQTAALAESARSAFWPRAVAALIVDALVLSVVFILVDTVFGVTHVTSGSPIPPPGGGFTTFTTSNDVGWVWKTLLAILYFAMLEALFGATVGKGVMRLRVVNEDGALLSPWQAVVRNVLRPIDGLPVLYLLGGIVALASPSRQRIGDRLAHTLVVPRSAHAGELLPREQMQRRLTLLGVVVAGLLIFCGAFYYFGRPPMVIAGDFNTGNGPFGRDATSYTLSAPMWGPGTVSYHISYTTGKPPDACTATWTLRWGGMYGWQDGYGVTSCAHHTP